MNINERLDYRDQVVKLIELNLFGPAGGENEVVSDQIFNRYLSGMLFPANLDPEKLEETSEPEVDRREVNVSGESTGDSSLSMAFESLPASMGISFFVKNVSQLKILAEAGRYKKRKEGEEENWYREPLGTPSNPEIISFKIPKDPKDYRDKKEIEWAEFHGVFRKHEDGFLVTIAMVNPGFSKKSKYSDEYAEATLFQSRFKVVVDDGVIGEYPTVDRLSMHREDEELSLIYQNRKTFGIGHGCAATWDTTATNSVSELVADPLPQVEVRGLTNEIKLPKDAEKGLNLRWLADDKRTISDYRSTFGEFIDAYKDWIKDQKTKLTRLESGQRGVAKTIIGRQEEAVRRIEAGIECICNSENNDTFTAFKFAQKSMLIQFEWSKQTEEGPFDYGEGQIEKFDPMDIPISDSPKWRPFQLAYQLLTIESIVNENSVDREVLDLLWFPTGGGKTEAYLALTAFEITRRRIVWGERGYGTSIWMRYTLRLLTSQQFERCATLISVMEDLRRSGEYDFLGTEPITLGLWVGSKYYSQLYE